MCFVFLLGLFNSVEFFFLFLVIGFGFVSFSLGDSLSHSFQFVYCLVFRISVWEFEFLEF